MNPDRQLTIDTLGDLDDGTLRHVVNKAIEEALTDCDNRPMLDKGRKLTLTVTASPILDDRSGAMRGVEIETQVQTKLPPRATHPDTLRTNVRGSTVEAYLPDAHQDSMFERDS